MRTSTLLNALYVAGALATPAHVHLHKRAIVTDLTVVTVTKYVTEGEASSTAHPPPPPPAPSSKPAPKVPVAQDGNSAKVIVVTKPAPAPAPAPSYQPAPAPAPKSSQAPAPAPAPAPSNGGNDVQSQILYHHNIHRQNHSAPALTWDTNLESTAQQLANTCVYGHNTQIGGGGYGQNIGFNCKDFPSFITDEMYNGEFEKFASYFGQANPPDFESWGHLTQIVWKDTQRVGCAVAQCANAHDQSGNNMGSGPFMVCNYGPPGNVEGQYGNQVGRPIGIAMAVAS